MLKTFEEIWKRIVELEGSEFWLVKGKVFTYKVSGNQIIPSTTDFPVQQNQFEKAWERMPVKGPGVIKDLMAPSYLFAILSDTRVCKK